MSSHFFILNIDKKGEAPIISGIVLLLIFGIMITFIIIVVCGVLSLLGIAKALRMLAKLKQVDNEAAKVTTLVKDDEAWRKKAIAFKIMDERKKMKTRIWLGLWGYVAVVCLIGAGLNFSLNYLYYGENVTLLDTVMAYAILIVVGCVCVAAFALPILIHLLGWRTVLYGK